MSIIFEVFEGTLNKYSGHLRTVVIPPNVTSIGDFAFYGCNEIEEVIFHENITSIGSFAFYGCDGIKQIQLPSNLNLIGPGAFSWCRNLEKIRIPNSIRIINKSTFFRCMNLQEITLPDTITSIEHSAFGHCKALKNIHLPHHLTHLGDFTFEECTHLQTITIPDSVTSIGKKAFLNCNHLKEINVSKNLKNVDIAAFETYSTLKFTSNDDLLLQPMMFDEYYNFDVKSKNEGHFLFHHSYLPHVEFEKWKKEAKIILLVNFLETYDLHIDKSMYLDKCEAYKKELIDLLMKQKRYEALNIALDNQVILPSEIEPYFETVTDREQKAKLLEYKNKTQNTTSIFDDLEDALMDLF